MFRYQRTPEADATFVEQLFVTAAERKPPDQRAPDRSIRACIFRGLGPIPQRACLAGAAGIHELALGTAELAKLRKISQGRSPSVSQPRRV